MEKASTLPIWEYEPSYTYLAQFISGLGFVGTNTLPRREEEYSGLAYDLNRIDSSSHFDVELDLVGTIDWTNCALGNLSEVYDECSEANWDGYDAAPISLEAYFEAMKLLRIIPNSFLMPDILPEPDGGIGLEWYKDRGFSFVISVCGKDTITYAGRFGKNSETYGTEDFTDLVPNVILNGLKRLFSSD